MYCWCFDPCVQAQAAREELSPCQDDALPGMVELRVFMHGSL